MKPKLNLLTIAALALMDTNAVLKSFEETAISITAAYARMGKLIWRYWQLTGSESGHYDAFRKYAEDSTISNATFFAKAYAALVVPGHLDDAQFEALTTFRVCRAVKKIMDDNAAVKISPEKIASILTSKDGGGADLASLAECGLTVKEKKAAEAAAKKAEKQAAADAAAKAKADAEELERLRAEKEAAAANPPPAETTPTVTAEEPEESEEESDDETEADPPAESSTPAAKPTAATPATPATPTAAAKPPPPVAKKPTTVKEHLDAGIAAMTTVDTTIAKLLEDPVANKGALSAIHTRLMASAESIEEALTAPIKAAASKAAA